MAHSGAIKQGNYCYQEACSQQIKDQMAPYIFAFLGVIVVKTIVEPLAKNIGRKLLAIYIEDACEILDNTVEMIGLDFDPEALVRQYLDLEGNGLSKRDIEAVVEAVFREWDLREIACVGKNV
jgi:hypothetical protein